MSQFDFPRISFHGTALLDTATANNGNYEPALTLFDQERSMTYLPPRCYYPQGSNFGPPLGYPIKIDKNNNQYAEIITINDTNYQAWAITPLGEFPADAACLDFYTNLQMNGKMPGYWNYYGDLSMALQNVLVTGITIPDITGGTMTYTPQSSQGCPANLAAMLGAELSFNLNYFEPGSRTSAFLCDVDSMGQMCTQIFCGTAGLYKTDGGQNTTFFTGSPVKSAAKWMNLTRLLNWVNMIPMGGSASFYSMIQLDAGTAIAEIFKEYTSVVVDRLFMKIMIHEVYEVRNPDYSLVPTKTIIDNKGNPVQVPKNPAIVSITGSITPWNIGDMQTTQLSRILKSTTSLTLNIKGIPDPVPIPQDSSQPIGVCSSVNLAPAQFIQNTTNNLISLDFINTINEYGINPGPFPVFAGIGDIQPFTEFVNYNYGIFTLNFQPDNGNPPITVGYITYINNYNMAQFLATGGMVDIPVTAGTDYSVGFFYLSLNGVNLMQEDDVFITTDQQGIYAGQNQVPANLYLADGLPRIPFILRVLYRGSPVAVQNQVNIVLQSINMVTGTFNNSNITAYDGMPYVFPVDTDGCLTYVFAYNTADLFTGAPGFAPVAAFAMRAYMIVLRVLAENLGLAQYLNEEMPVNWDAVYNNIFVLYKTLYPVMDAILPMNQENWSDPFIQNKLIQLTDEIYWNKPLFMPVTRDMTAAQRQLLNLWVEQSQNSPT